MKHDHRDWVRSLYDQYAPDLYRLARYRLRDPDLAHDLVQEVFLTLVAKAPEVRDHPNPIAWLLKTMEYKLLKSCLDRTRGLTLRAQQRTEAGGLLPWIFVVDRDDTH